MGAGLEHPRPATYSIRIAHLVMRPPTYKVTGRFNQWSQIANDQAIHIQQQDLGAKAPSGF
jgi:hypothetical protein